MRGRHKSDPVGTGRVAYATLVALVALVLVVIGVLAVTSVL
jgi:Flp pilus assembly pilin Flp